MAVHDEVLQAALQRCANSGTWQFTLQEVVRSLPHLNERTVRTHVTSRCCVNAPKNHQHRLAYFRRVSRAVYEILQKYRSGRPAGDAPLRDSLHVTVSRSDGTFTAECLEVPVITEGADLDDLLQNLREALLLHFEDEDLALLGLARHLRLIVTAEFPLAVSA